MKKEAKKYRKLRKKYMNFFKDRFRDLKKEKIKVSLLDIYEVGYNNGFKAGQIEYKKNNIDSPFNDSKTFKA